MTPLRQTDEFHRRYHEGRDHLRARLHALELAEDPAFQAQVEELAGELDESRLSPGLTLDEFKQRYQVN